MNCLVAGQSRVGVDAGEVDLVAEMSKVGDPVAAAAGGRGVDAVEVVEVAAGAAGEEIAAPTALKPVVGAVAEEAVVAATADGTLDPGERVGLTAALGRVAGLVGIERRGSCWPWLVCSGGEVKHGRWLGKALPAVDLA